MDSDEEPEDRDVDCEPDEAVDPLRRKVEPLPSEEEQKNTELPTFPFEVGVLTV